jgi:hypothetical protein
VKVRRSNEVPAKKKENNMKTRNLILTLGTAALAATAFNLTAADALLSPRAAGNQITRVSGTANNVSSSKPAGVTASPRASGNQASTASAPSRGRNLASVCQKNMAATPKTVQACAEHPAAAMPCCGGKWQNK